MKNNSNENLRVKYFEISPNIFELKFKKEQVNNISCFTINSEVTQEEKFFKYSSLGYYGHVVLEIKPHSDQALILFENTLKPDILPKETIIDILEGIHEYFQKLYSDGKIIVGLKVKLIDSLYHPIDSVPKARIFPHKIAAYQALELAFQKLNLIESSEYNLNQE